MTERAKHRLLQQNEGSQGSHEDNRRKSVSPTWAISISLWVGIGDMNSPIPVSVGSGRTQLQCFSEVFLPYVFLCQPITKFLTNGMFWIILSRVFAYACNFCDAHDAECGAAAAFQNASFHLDLHFL